jgi:transcription elongation factor Elf1
MKDEPHLKHARNIDFFGCSMCGLAFKPNHNDQSEMVRLFHEHVRAVHPTKKPREDVNQAAARVVRDTRSSQALAGGVFI